MVIDEDHFSFERAARRASRFLEEHETQETHHLGLGEETEQHATETNRFHAEGRGFRVAGVARVEDEVDDVQHGAEPRRQFVRRGHLVRDGLRSDGRLRADDALRERRRRDEEEIGRASCRERV